MNIEFWKWYQWRLDVGFGNTNKIFDFCLWGCQWKIRPSCQWKIGICFMRALMKNWTFVYEGANARLDLVTNEILDFGFRKSPMKDWTLVFSGCQWKIGPLGFSVANERFDFCYKRVWLPDILDIDDDVIGRQTWILLVPQVCSSASKLHVCSWENPRFSVD